MGDELAAGLYETLLTKGLDARLRALDGRLSPVVDTLHPSEAADRIALHLSKVVELALGDVKDVDRVRVGVRLVESLLTRIETELEFDVQHDRPVSDGAVLRALQPPNPDGSPHPIPQPLIPLLDTTLLTNAPGEPTVGSQIRTEVESADRIDLVMAFIRMTGIAPLRDALATHRRAGRHVRVLTTTYTGSTERRALDVLRDLGADVRVSYDTTTTRLHAKAWLFHRESGYSTAYVGSSNLTHSAQVSGLEWNVRLSSARNPSVIQKIEAVFDSYWESGDFRPYDPAEFDELTERPTFDVTDIISPIEIRLEPFQDRLLEQIDVARTHGRHRNLLVSATGTGKTVMAAVDYARLRSRLDRDRLLFVAHRAEILRQSLSTFRHALRDPSFGELWVDGDRPRRFEHVFASIQSLNAVGVEALDPRHFDVVIVDEFHHAAAPSYRRLLDHVEPAELLGLTATPERADGLPILDWFDGRIAAELRLWDAIDQQRLVPFSYFGIHDGLDYRHVPWRRGQGYDTASLTSLYTANHVWARQVVKELVDHVGDVSTARVLAFCCSVDHARWMADRFNDAGIRATAVWADTPSDERRQALLDLAVGRVNVIFSVDLFNEGVDIPTVDTLLLLRPTDSPTLFLQQLGRGLRRAEGKAECLVLDFVGLHRKEFRFDLRYRALLGGTRKDLIERVEAGFPFLPAGCHLSLDPVAADLVLKNIRESVPTRWAAKALELQHVAAAAGGDVGLAPFLDESGLDLDDVYTGNRSWSDLREEAGLPVAAAGPHEAILRRAIGRSDHINDDERLRTYRRWLVEPVAPRVDALSERERRLARMLVVSLSAQVLERLDTLQSALDRLWTHPQVIAEAAELFALLTDRVDHLQHRLATHRDDVPLLVHARYTRLEILSAFDVGDVVKPMSWQTGVLWVPEAGADLFTITLDKSGGGFSPTTRYRDYAISRELIHWESQSSTRADSAAGQRYQNHEADGSEVMLFARLRNDERAFWFLGPATYVGHQSERPMQITWRLHHELSGDLYAAFASAVA